MADGSNIEWTDSTWNPTVGCSVVSPGCTNCYAMKVAHRFGGSMPWSPAGPNAKYAGLTKTVNFNPVWTGKVRLDEKALDIPLRWRKPRRIFVNSMSDLFHESIPDDWIDRVFAVMALAPQHTFQVLTKRSARMREYMADRSYGCGYWEHWAKKMLRERSGDPGKPVMVGKTLAGTWPWPHVWLGVSIEDQQRADERIPDLLQTPAAVRFISAEPLLGPVDLRVPAPSGLRFLAPLDWVIVGGESGPGARPMHPDWARSLRDQCAGASVPFFFKQWGEYAPQQPVYWEEDKIAADLFVKKHYGPDERVGDWDLSAADAIDWMKDFPDLGVLYRDGHFYDGVEWQPHVRSGCWWMERVGKKAAGHLLDGREHREFPEARDD